MVYDYLTTMGYDDPTRVQQEAANSDLSCMIRFYTGEYVLLFSVVLLELNNQQQTGVMKQRHC